MDSIKEVENEIEAFTKERDWDQFHTPENLAKSISIEANELLECFQWDGKNFKTEDVKEELADVFNYCFQMASVMGFDIRKIIEDKMLKNAKKYPVEKAKGSSKKYTELK
jgi:dCTP diphosphatase